MNTDNRPMTAMALEILQGIMSMVLHLLSPEQISNIEAKLASNPTTKWGNDAVYKMILIARKAGVVIPAYRIRLEGSAEFDTVYTHIDEVWAFIAMLQRYDVKFTSVVPVKQEVKPKWRRKAFNSKAEALLWQSEHPGWLGPNKKDDKWVVYQLND